MKAIVWKRILSAACVVVMILGVALSAAAGSEWQTDIRLSITKDSRLLQEAGMDLKQWDEAVAQQKQAGLADPVTREMLLAADANAVILEQDGKVFQIGPSTLFGKVTNALEAYRLAYRLAELCSGSALADLCLRAKLTMNDKTVYAFDQVCDGQEACDGQKVLGGTLKIALDGSQEVTAVFANLAPEACREQKLMTREEAEAVAADKASAEVLAEYTGRAFVSPVGFAMALNMDEDLDPIPDDIAWIVYTANDEDPDGYPYTAHYIKLDGTYLRSLPVKEPGDPEAMCGYRRKDVFAGMTADTYTGELTDIDGNVKTVTVPVMWNEADGCWYLGDVERKIAFADYFEAAYGETHDIVLLKSEDNTWDAEDIYAFWNYLRAWQFYADMGWIGPDGQGTDVIILSGMCYSDGTVYDNACSMGLLEGWQVFSYAPYNAWGEPTRLTWALDIMAHEFTHTFTGTTMLMNLYENDMGAINEAMSDIFGNLAEYICKDTADTEWIIGENSGDPLRKMAVPEYFGQPESVWGKYYVPQVKKPNTVNDRGGVHYNSSLLNLIAYRLCADYGMSYEDAVRLWVMVALGLTPRTDYYQMSSLLEWAVGESGESGQYEEALGRIVAETRIDRTDLPESLPEGQKLIRLKLPDTPAFRDNDEWCLYITQMDLKTKEALKEELLKTAADLLTDPEKIQEFRESLKQLVGNLELKKSEFGRPKIVLKDNENIELKDHLLSRLFQNLADDVIEGETAIFSWEVMDSDVIHAVLDDKPTIYILMNISKGGSQLEKLVYLIGSSWYDLTDFMMEDAYNEDEGIREKLSKLTKELGKQGLRNLLSAVKEGVGKGTASDSGNIRIEELPTAGLEYIELPVQ